MNRYSSILCGLKVFSFFILILLFVFSADVVFAHRVVLFAWIEGNTVFTESQFPDGRKIADGQVNVFDMDHNLLVEGKTDANGEFSFKIPENVALNIVLDAGMGHQGQWKLSEDEVNSAMGAENQEPGDKKNKSRPDLAESSEKQPSSESLKPKESLHSTGETILLNEKQLDQMIEKAVEKALDKKLEHVNGMLSRILAGMQVKGPSVNDIFGGIGYILGFFGIAAYFLSKKRNEK
jgi:nickel transport protein